MTQAGTSFYSRQTYFPYGASRTTEGSALPTDYTFTGQKSDDSTGLMFYNARYYDTSLGRFTQPDTIVPNPLNPQSLNRFAYVLNNPLKYTDPTGHTQSCGDVDCDLGDITPSEDAGEDESVEQCSDQDFDCDNIADDEQTQNPPATTGGNQYPNGKECWPKCALDEIVSNAIGRFEAIGIAWDWFWENGMEYQRFGPDRKVTHELMRDEGVAEARKAYLDQGTPQPFTYFYGFGIDDYPRETLQALTLQDVTGSVLGSYRVDIYDKNDGKVLFIVSNITGWESGTRNPFGGSSTSSVEGILFRGQSLMNPKSILENRARAENGPGGNLYQSYFWEERLFSSGFR